MAKRKVKDSAAYVRERKWFLAEPENARCPVAAAGLIPDLSGELHPHHRASTTIHHAWRRGRYYLDKSTWLACSMEGHAWIESNPERARRIGWLADTADTQARWRKSHGGMPLQ